MDISRRGLLAAGVGVSMASPSEAAPGLAAPPKRLRIHPSAPAYIRPAAEDLAGDFVRAFGRAPRIVTGGAPEPGDLVLSLASDPVSQAALRELAVSAPATPESFVAVLDPGRPQLLVGADGPGLRRSIYHYAARVLGVDPTWRWTGLKPQRPAAAPRRIAEGAPAFPLRGWFINDEDLLTEWRSPSGRRRSDYRYYKDIVSLESLEAVLETLLRLDYNLVVPASLLNIFNPAEQRLLDACARRGLKVSQHHIEPVGVSAFTFDNYWSDRGQKPPFSFLSARPQLVETWRAAVDAWSRYDTVWTLGLRGVGDRPMWLADPKIPRDNAVIGRLISDAISVQRDLVRARQPDAVLTTVLWAEGAYLLAEGHLKIPPDVMVVFSDNGPGARMHADYVTTLREETRRYGVYYHHQIWGAGPHLAQAVRPETTAAILRHAAEHQTHDYVLFNVSNVREFVLGVTESAKMALAPQAYHPSEDMRRTLGRWFGEAHSAEALQVYAAYFDAFHIDEADRRPSLTDGLLRSRSRRMLQVLEGAPKAQASTIEAETEAWAKAAIGDNGEADYGAEIFLRHGSAQAARFRAVSVQAGRLQGKLAAEPARFLGDNLIAHAEIMEGLSLWACALERAAATAPAERAARLDEALAGLALTRRGMARASHGAWADWYRGDRKMDIAELEARTLAQRRRLPEPSPDGAKPRA